MKKFLSLAFCVVMIVMSSCTKTENIEYKPEPIAKIAVTTFPFYDIVKEIIGRNNEEIELILLEDSGIDMHSFNPSAKDFDNIATSNLFIYGGGESDEWVTDGINANVIDKNKSLNILDELRKENLLLMEEEEHHHEDEDEHHEDEEEHHEEEDEHVWLSLINAKSITNIISKRLLEFDDFSNNANNLINKLDNLDEEYKKVFDISGSKVVVLADRNPFNYLFNDYSIECHAAFSGCSAESEASFEKVVSLASEIDKYKLKYVFKLEGNNEKLARSVIDNTKDKDMKIVSIDSMQSINKKDIDNGVNYIDIMKNNLEVFKEAIGK